MPIGIPLKKEEITLGFINNEYTILSDDYSKAKDKILVKCKNGHINYRTYDNLKQGRGCPDCAGVKKYTYEYVYNYFKLQDCLLLEEQYINCKIPMKYLCSCGNESYVSFDNFKSKNYRCRDCGNFKISIAKKIPFNEVVTRIKLDGNKLLTKEKDYIDANNDIVVECKCGNKFITTFTRYKSRVYQTCVECAFNLAKENMRRNELDINYILSSNGLELIDYNYINNEHIVTYKCFCGNYEIVNFNIFLARTHKMCLQCSKIIKDEKERKYSIEEINPIFINKNWQLLSTEFKSVDHDLECICDKGHYTTTTLYRFTHGCGCRECFLEYNKRENHWNWQGGISELKAYLREQLREWKYKSLENYNFICYLSKTNYNLNVHHLDKSFSSIVYETLDKLQLPLYSIIGDYSKDELDSIIKLFLELHDKYGYGIPLESDLHNLFHKLYGTKNNTREQFLEFSQRYKKGEFDELKLKNIS